MDDCIIEKIEFIDNGTTPEFFVNGLQDVEVMGAVSRFVFFVLRKTATGVLFREPVFSYVTPNEAIGTNLALVVSKTGGVITVPRKLDGEGH